VYCWTTVHKHIVPAFFVYCTHVQGRDIYFNLAKHNSFRVKCQICFSSFSFFHADLKYCIIDLLYSCVCMFKSLVRYSYPHLCHLWTENLIKFCLTPFFLFSCQICKQILTAQNMLYSCSPRILQKYRNTTHKRRYILRLCGILPFVIVQC
jgi:hypothetical protein